MTRTTFCQCGQLKEARAACCDECFLAGKRKLIARADHKIAQEYGVNVRSVRSLGGSERIARMAPEARRLMFGLARKGRAK